MSAARELRGQHVHVSAESGAAGDMTLGALLQVGVPAEVIERALAAVGVGGRMRARAVVKGGIAAIDVTIRVDEDDHHDAHADAHVKGSDHVAVADHAHHHGHDHHHDHDHGRHHHEHTKYADIVARIEGADLDGETRRRALDVFARIARAEAKLHGTTVDQVAFHEVGAIDSIADVVGSAAGLAWLAPASVSCGAIAMGQGSVGSAHGRLPVPSPAALEILREAGAPVKGGGVELELTTPTGAAILAHAVTAWGGMPALTTLAIGHGAGDRDLADRPNVLRLVVGRPVGGAAERIVRIEANVDDMSPELCEHAAAAIVAAGAVDVWWTPIVMKKSRPATLLSALAPPAARDAVVRAILRETTTIGVRWDECDRVALPREHAVVATPYGPLPVKLARLDGAVVNAAPEYEACRAAAQAHGVPLKDVYAAAIAALHRSDR